MKVTMTITDKPSGNCDLEVHFDPPIKRGEIAQTNAGRTALAFIEFMKGKAQSVEATTVQTEVPRSHERSHDE